MQNSWKRRYIQNTDFYKIFFRQSEERALLLSEAQPVVEEIMRYIAKSIGSNKIEFVYIDVNGLVNMIMEQPDNYIVTAIHAKTSGYGARLKSVSLYGNDITSVSLLLDNKNNFVFYMCGLREVKSFRESVRIGKEGQVSCYYNSIGSLKNIENTLKYITLNNFLI